MRARDKLFVNFEFKIFMFITKVNDWSYYFTKIKGDI